VSTLDRFHDESECRLLMPACYIVDSEGPADIKASLKSEMRIMVWIAAYVMALRAGLKRYHDAGCLHRVTDLTSGSVQNCSDQDLDWIIQNAIRFTGMRGFGEVETPEHIWAS